MNKKKLLALLMALVMTLTLVPVTAFAEGTATATENSVASVTVGETVTYYESLQEALNNASTAGADATVDVLKNINLQQAAWNSVYLDGYNGAAKNVVVRGHDYSISGLSAPLFLGTWSNTTIKIYDLTVKDSAIEGVYSDGCGGNVSSAFIGCVSASRGTLLDHCTVSNCTFTGGKYSGAFVGYAAGYGKQNDGPVFSDITISDCTATNNTITGTGSSGALMGHATGDAWTYVIITGASATGNTITGENASKTGILVGTLGVGQTHLGQDGGLWIEATESGNTLTAGQYEIGRIGSDGGMGFFTQGGSYTVNPLLTSDPATGTIAAEEGYTAVQNGNTWTIGTEPVAEPTYVAQNGDVKYETLAAAVAAAESGATIELIADTDELSDDSELQINKTLTITGAVDANGNPLYTIYGKNDTAGYNDIFICGNANDTITLSNIKISDFGGGAKANNKYAAVYVSKDNAAKVVLDNVYITNSNSVGLRLAGNNTTFEVKSCYIDSEKSTVYNGDLLSGIKIYDGATGSITESVIVNAASESSTWQTAGIELFGTGDVEVTECVITSNNHWGMGIAMDTTTANMPASSTVAITNCIIEVPYFAVVNMGREEGSFTIDGGDYSGYIGSYLANGMRIIDGSFDNYICSDSAEGIVIEGGTFTGAFDEDTKYPEDAFVLKGGYYLDSNPEDCINVSIYDGYIVTSAVDPDDEDYTWYHVEKNKVAIIDEVEYETLQAAFNAADNGETITLLKNIDLTSTVIVDLDDKAVTLDLVDYNITAIGCRALWVKSGDVTISGSGTISSTDLASSSSVIRVGDASGQNDVAPVYPAALTIGENVTVSSNACYGVTVFGKTGQTLVVNGTISVTGTTSAISGNGNSWLGKTNITINNGAVVSAEHSAAIYHPQDGLLTVNGGTISGTAGIEAKGGDVTISGGTITATAQTTSHSINNNGTSTDGFALAAVKNSGYKGDGNFTVTGGTFDGPICIVEDNSSTHNTSIAISGGTFSEEPDKAYVKAGYEAVATNTTWTVGKVVAGTNLEPTTTTSNSATFAVSKSVVDEQTNTNLLEKPETSFSVTVTAPTENLDSGKESIQLSNINIDEVVAAAVDKADEQSETNASVVVQLAKDKDAEAITVDNVKQITIEVHPEAIITVTKTGVEDVVTTVPLSNDQIQGTFTFTLDVSAVVSGDGEINLYHKHGETGEIEYLGVHTVTDGKITVKGITSFSEFIAKEVTSSDNSVTVGVVGASLRRRVNLYNHDEVVNTSTDFRVTFQWNVTGSVQVKPTESKLLWSSDGGNNWVQVPIQFYDSTNNRVSLVITGIPRAAFGTLITTKLHLVYDDGTADTSVDVTAPVYSVNSIANALAERGPNDQWGAYGKFLRGEYESYTLVDGDPFFTVGNAQ